MRQILADVFDIPLATVNVTEGAAYRAALLAAVGRGRPSNVEGGCDSVVKTTGTVSPSAALARVKDAVEELTCPLLVGPARTDSSSGSACETRFAL